MAVVVLHEDLENALKMLGVLDSSLLRHSERTVRTSPLRHAVRLRRAKRCVNDLEPMASKHRVKTVSEFLVPVADQEAERLWAFCQSPRQLPGLLCHPRRGRIRRAAHDVHSAAA